MTDRQDNLRNVIRKVLAQRYKCITTFHKLYEHFYFQRLRKRNKNTDFSLFSPNCYAGLIYHRLGLQFQSPTINMLFPSKKEYLKFVSNLSYYMSLELEEIKDKRFPYPAGMVGDVELIFNHYLSFQEANEATYLQWYGAELSDENKLQFYISPGFAHGFLVLSDVAEFCYKCTDFYHPNDEGGLAWNDPKIGIKWPEIIGEYQGSANAEGYSLPDGTPLNISEKDQKWAVL